MTAPDRSPTGAHRARAAPSRPATPPAETQEWPRAVSVSTALLLALVVAIVGGYGLNWSWTGFQDGRNDTLWAWLALFLMPVTLALLPLLLRPDPEDRRLLRGALPGLVLVLLLLLVGGYLFRWRWTGVPPDAAAAEPDAAHWKYLWDWLTVALLPLTLFVLPRWLASRRTHRREWTLTLGAVGGIFAILIAGGYGLHWTWTGFEGNTLWDWLGLFLVPFALPAALAVADSRDSLRGEGARSEAASKPSEVLPTASARTPAGPTLVGTALVAALVLIAALVLHHPEAAARPASTEPSIPRVVTVPANRAWTDTGLDVAAGQQLAVQATGAATAAHGLAPIGPAGMAGGEHQSANVVPSAGHAALIGRIGATGRPFPVGASLVVAAPSAGRLFLGVNDTGVTNNGGWYIAKVQLGSTATGTGP